MTICGNLMASGGADDRIFVYDLNTRQEHCMLTHHNSTINCLTFTPMHSHLISGTADGCISLVRVGNWQLEKVWEKAHKGAAILDIAVHETGKLALSLGADCSLKTWNLVKGRQAYIVNLNSKSKDAKSLTNIRWAPDGVRFVLCGGKYTDIWSIDSGGVLLSVEHENKVASCLWLSNEELLVGYEKGHLGVVSAKDGSIKLKDAHGGRVKAMSKYEDFVVTICSSGEFKVWDVALNEMAKIDTGCRLTCISVIPQAQVKKEDGVEGVEEENEEINDSSEEELLNKRGEVVIIEEEQDDIFEDSKKLRKKKNKNNNKPEIKKMKKKKKSNNNTEETESTAPKKKRKSLKSV